MEKDMIKEINTFFASVYRYLDDVAKCYVHPKRLAECKATKQQVINLQQLLNRALNTQDFVEVYKLVHLRHHPNYQVSFQGFEMPYENNNGNSMYLIFNDVIRVICEYIERGTDDKMYASAVISEIRKWNFKMSLKGKNKEYDFIPVIKKFFNDVFVFANKNVAKYTMPASKSQCEQGIKKLQNIKNEIERIISLKDFERQDFESYGMYVMNEHFYISNKLFTDSEHQNDNTVYHIFGDVLKGIIKYYQEDMKNPELILSQIQRWYVATSSNVFQRIQNKFKPMSRFGR